jgi:hypothetical protein
MCLGFYVQVPTAKQGTRNNRYVPNMPSLSQAAPKLTRTWSTAPGRLVISVGELMPVGGGWAGCRRHAIMIGAAPPLRCHKPKGESQANLALGHGRCRVCGAAVRRGRGRGVVAIRPSSIQAPARAPCQPYQKSDTPCLGEGGNGRTRARIGSSASRYRRHIALGLLSCLVTCTTHEGGITRHGTR